MQSHSRSTYLKSIYPEITDDAAIKAEQNIGSALETLAKEEKLIKSFNEENLKSLYKIEMINPVYFPGLSITAAYTMLTLHKANPTLSVELLLTTTDGLARRGRPWESLAAFSRIAAACPKQVNEDLLSYLLNTDSDILEICSHQIEQESKEKMSGVIGIQSRLYLSQEVDVRDIIYNKINWALNSRNHFMRSLSGLV